MLKKNTEYCVLEPRETRSSTDINSTGKKTMFKKFAMLLTSFALASFGSLLSDSAVHATLKWTRWDNCYFTYGWGADYTPWRALIEVRSTDYAARVVQVQYGNGNDESISTIVLQESRKLDDGDVQLLQPPVVLRPGNRTNLTSPMLSNLPFVSTLFEPRYITVGFTRTDNTDSTCSSYMTF